MTTLKNALPTLFLGLMVAASVSAAPGTGREAHTLEAKPKMQTPFQTSLPVIKIDRAMMQEREALPDGTVHVGTYENYGSVTTAKSAAPKTGVSKA